MEIFVDSNIDKKNKGITMLNSTFLMKRIKKNDK